MLENNDSSQVIIKDCVDGGCNREVTPFLCKFAQHGRLL